MYFCFVMGKKTHNVNWLGITYGPLEFNSDRDQVVYQKLHVNGAGLDTPHPMIFFQGLQDNQTLHMQSFPCVTIWNVTERNDDTWSWTGYPWIQTGALQSTNGVISITWLLFNPIWPWATFSWSELISLERLPLRLKGQVPKYGFLRTVHKLLSS